MSQGELPGHEVLLHWSEIGQYIGVKPAAARYLSATAGLPIFHPSPCSVASTRALIDAWMAERLSTLTVASPPKPKEVSGSTDSRAQPGYRAMILHALGTTDTR